MEDYHNEKNAKTFYEIIANLESSCLDPLTSSNYLESRRLQKPESSASDMITPLKTVQPLCTIDLYNHCIYH